jgi:cysteinyl-tRNA synthetase
MAIRLHNTLTRSKEEFVPRDPGRVAMYVCGPTVYNDIHIGNARTFLSFDVIRRYLVWRGFDVDFVQNITDVDDKIINRAKEQGVSAAEVARTYTEHFLEAMKSLGIMPPTHQPRATEEIPEMIAMVERLIEAGHAYDVQGDVYFSVRSFEEYGKLSGRDLEDLMSGAGQRVEVDERKRDPLDFALWKAAKPGEPHWPSPWGEGRPGWHLECSVMSEKYLGLSFDIHGGGADLVFPHHENEVAQSEAATGEPFARYWLHGGMLQINAEKMSKSLGNFVTLKDVLDSHCADEFRLLALQTHYRSPLDFSDDRIDEAAAALERLANVIRNLRWAQDVPPAGTGADEEERAALLTSAEEAREKFTAEMDDDFNSAGGMAAIFELARVANVFLSDHAKLATDDIRALEVVGDALVELTGVLGLTLGDVQAAAYPYAVVELARSLAGYEGDDTSAAVAALLRARDAARAVKDWRAADAIRDALEAHNLRIEDTPNGSRLVFRD